MTAGALFSTLWVYSHATHISNHAHLHIPLHQRLVGGAGPCCRLLSHRLRNRSRGGGGCRCGHATVRLTAAATHGLNAAQRGCEVCQHKLHTCRTHICGSGGHASLFSPVKQSSAPPQPFKTSEGASQSVCCKTGADFVLQLQLTCSREDIDLHLPLRLTRSFKCLQ